MDESQQRKSGAILSYISIIVSILVQLAYTPILINKLGQSEYGLYSLVTSIIGSLTVLELGFGNAIIVFTAKYRANKQYDEEKKLHGMFFAVFLVIGIIAALLGVMLFFLAPIIFKNSMSDIELKKIQIMMLILAFNLFITFAFNIYSSIISAYEKFTFQKIITIINTLLKPILMLPFLFLGFKSITLTIILTIVNIFVCLLNYLYCKKSLNINIRFLGFDKAIFKIIFGYSIWVFLGTIVDKINWSVDQFILGAVSGTTAISIYSVASQLNTLFVSLSIAISGVMLPKMSKMVAKDATNEQLTDEFVKVGRLQYYIIFLMASGLVIFGKEFIMLWAGSKYKQSYYVALLLIIPVCIPLIQNLGLSILQAKQKFKFKAILTSIMAIFNLIISVILAKKFGAIGSAIGTAGALIICNIIIMNIYYQRNIGINVFKFWKSILKMTICFAIPLILIILFMKTIILEGIIGYLVYIMSYILIYCIISFAFVMDKYEKNLTVNILKKFKIIR